MVGGKRSGAGASGSGAEVSQTGSGGTSAPTPEEHATNDLTSRDTMPDTVFSTMREPFVSLDPAGRIMRWSTGAELMFGWSAPEAIGRDVDELIVSPRSRMEYRLARARAARPDHPVPQHPLLWMRYRDGTEFPVDASVSAPANSDGRRIYTFLHDVTDLLRATRFKDCQLAVAQILDRDAPLPETGVATLRVVLKALGWIRAEMWLADDTLDELRLTTVIDEHGESVESEQATTLGHGIAGRAWRNGEPVWLSDLGTAEPAVPAGSVAALGVRTAAAVPIRGAKHVLGVFVFFARTVADPPEALLTLLPGIAAHVGLFLERHRATSLTTELARTKDEYIGLVGHELRTPLTSISAYTDLIMDDPTLSDEHRALLEVVRRNAMVLRGIINDLLDLTALDSGHVTLQLKPTNLADVVRDVLETAASAIAEQQLAVVCDIVSTIVVAGDEPRLCQVVENLISNAVKYTPPGGTITIQLRRAGGYASLSIADTGIGIPQAERARLFHRFFRGASATEQGVPGTGLGLALSRVIVDKHGGTIGVADRQRPGTTFLVRLPLLPESP